MTNAAGEPIVVASELSPAVNVLAAAIELSEKGSSLDCWSLVKTGVGLLREQLPLALPPLESLEIKQVEKQEGTDGQ